MDYVEIIERSVTQAWAEGKTTPQIKAELAAKHWPEDMVEAVIDRLVKKRVEQQEGKLPELGGPDWWTQPTWPVGESWALLNRQRRGDTPGGMPTETVSPADIANNGIDNNSASDREDNQTELTPNPTQIPTPQLPVATPSPSSPVRAGRTPEQIVSQLKNKHSTQPGLLDRLRQANNREVLDGQIQNKSLIFLGVLLLVIILAICWRVFVIK